MRPGPAKRDVLTFDPKTSERWARWSEKESAVRAASWTHAQSNVGPVAGQNFDLGTRQAERLGGRLEKLGRPSPRQDTRRQCGVPIVAALERFGQTPPRHIDEP